MLTGICPACQPAPSPEVYARLDRLFCKAVRAVVFAAKAAGVVAVVMILYCTPVIRAPLSHSRFSSEEWIRGDVQSRGSMARDLILSKQLAKKSPEEVRAILGIPDSESLGGLTIRFRVDIGYRWIIRPYPYDLVVQFGKGREVIWVTLKPQAKEGDY